MKVRIATFNAENLFARFRFQGKRVKQGGGFVYREFTDAELGQISREGWDVNETFFAPFPENERRLTAQTLAAARADIVGLQEVESLDTLKKFLARHISLSRYRYRLLIDANDPRFIDVGLLSDKKFPLDYVVTHQFERTANNKSFVFSRDCLEVGVRLSQNTVLPVFVNHFKSMIGGRAQTMARRKLQSEKVTAILKRRFGADPGKKAWVVLGDLNDYLPSSGLAPLVGQPWAVNAVESIGDPNDRWTHYYAGKNEYRQLDYILVSRSLTQANTNLKVEIIRKGLPIRAARYTGARFDGVGQNHPKASDHCPLVVELNV